MKTELYHHGVKGQQWGVRRFQNPDGTLTAEGRKRYNELTKAENSNTEALRNKGVEDSVLKKGQTITRATVKGEELTHRRIYAAILDSDIDFYSDAVQNQRLGATTNPNGEDAYQLTLEAVKDIKIATFEDQLNFYMQENANKTVEEFLQPIEDDYGYGEKWNKIIDEIGNIPIGNYAEDIKMIRSRTDIERKDKDRKDLEAATETVKTLAEYANEVLVYDITINPDNPKEYFTKKHDEFLKRMGKAGYDAFVDIYDYNGEISKFPVIVTNPDKKFTVKSKTNYRKKEDVENVERWLEKPKLLKKGLSMPMYRQRVLDTIGNAWDKTSERDRKKLTKFLPRNIRKQQVRNMDRYANYLKEHPNSDMKFNEFMAMEEKSKESKK